VAQLGANAHGEVLEPGRVPDCYLGLDPDDDAQAAGVLVVAPPRSCIRLCRSRTESCCTSWRPATPTGHPASWCSWPT
jgi:hypothetical protein